MDTFKITVLKPGSKVTNSVTVYLSDFELTFGHSFYLDLSKFLTAVYEHNQDNSFEITIINNVGEPLVVSTKNAVMHFKNCILKKYN